jgi:hypothetical protein
MQRSWDEAREKRKKKTGKRRQIKQEETES